MIVLQVRTKTQLPKVFVPFALEANLVLMDLVKVLKVLVRAATKENTVLVQGKSPIPRVPTARWDFTTMKQHARHAFRVTEENFRTKWGN
tara:strand:+ start:533 stop:802 length:270 start_codon:yes stop_codon:yes gene_type:complete